MRDNPRRAPPPSSSNCRQPCTKQASEQSPMPSSSLEDLRLDHCDPTGCLSLSFIGSTRAAAGIYNTSNTTKHSCTGVRPPTDMSIPPGFHVHKSRLGSVYCQYQGARDAFSCSTCSSGGAARLPPPKGRQGGPLHCKCRSPSLNPRKFLAAHCANSRIVVLLLNATHLRPPAQPAAPRSVFEMPTCPGVGRGARGAEA